MKRRHHLTGASVAIIWGTCAPLAAQVVHDGTVGPAVGVAGPDYAIPAGNGTVAGGTLFHSFSEFSVGAGESATFTGPNGLDAVVSRVTGGEPSTIDGPVRSAVPGADFWFVNPAGIALGPEGSFDVPAGLHVATASEVGFADGSTFAAGPGAAATLTTAPPVAFGFAGGEGSLRLDGTGLALAGDATLAGADVAIADSGIVGDGGRLRVAAVGAGGGTVTVGDDAAPADATGALTVQGSVLFDGTGRGGFEFAGGSLRIDQSILQLENTSETAAAGALALDADTILITDSAALGTVASGAGAGAPIRLRGDVVSLTVASQLRTDALGDGRGGPIEIVAGDLAVGSIAGVFTTASGTGRGGAISVTADTVSLADLAAIGTITETTADLPSGTVTGGDVRLELGERLVLDSLAGVVTQTFGTGGAGDVLISAGDSVTVTTPQPNATGLLSRIASDVTAGATGGGGDVSVEAPEIVLEAANITSGTVGEGDAGTVTLRASERLSLSGAAAVLTATGGAGESAGRGGLIEIEAAHVDMDEGSVLSASTVGAGLGGAIRIDAGDVDIQDTSGVRAEAFGTGAAGSIEIEARGRIRIDAGLVGSSTSGAGRGGSIRVAGAERLAITNYGQIFAGPAAGASGGGGPIEVDVGRLVIDGSAEVPVDLLTGISSTAQPGSSGSAGSVDVRAESIALRDGGSISSETGGSGAGGEVSIAVAGSLVASGVAAFNPDIGSGVFVTARGTSPDATGGSIDLQAGRIELTDGAGIFADAFGVARGGDIRIAVDERMVVDNAFIGSTPRSAGDAGAVTITRAPQLTLRNEGRIFSGPFDRATGAGGPITVNAGRLLIDGAGDGEAVFETGISSSGQPATTGAAGPVIVTADDVRLVNGGRISSNALGSGAGGSLVVDVARTFVAEGFDPSDPRRTSGLSVSTDGVGRQAVGGSIDLAASEIVLRDGAEIDAQALGVARGGDILIDARQSMLVDGAFIGATTRGAGDGGSVEVVRAPSFTLRNEGRIFNGPAELAEGDGGPISVSAGAVLIDGGGDSAPTFLTGLSSTAQPGTSGAAGDVTVVADTITLVDGGDISTSTFGLGPGGAVSVTARDAFVANGVSPFFPGVASGVSAQTDGLGPAAAGGDVRVRAREVRLADGALINAESGGLADAGSILVEGDLSVRLDNAIISTAAADGGGGQIAVNATELVQLRGSLIASSVAGTGDTTAGDIAIDPQFVVLDDSAILAQATAGMGGNISISTGTLVLSPQSIIDASAETGIDGTVTTGSPAEDVSARIAQLAAQFQNPDALLRDGCDRRAIADASTFALVGGAVVPASDAPLTAGYDLGQPPARGNLPASSGTDPCVVGAR